MEIDNAKNNNFDIVPSQNTIYKMLKVLISENNKLKKKITRLENKVFKKKKKINVIDWLNTQNNSVNNIIYKNYQTFFDNLTLNDSLQHMFHNSYINGYFIIINYLLKENILVAWSQKKQIYYYNDGWFIFKVEDLTNLIRKIQRNIICELYEKKEEISNEKFIDVNNNILGGTNEERNAKNNKIYKKIWDCLNCDIDNQQEFKIMF